jgi:hypothetical protein
MTKKIVLTLVIVLALAAGSAYVVLGTRPAVNGDFSVPGPTVESGSTDVEDVAAESVTSAQEVFPDD